MVSFTDGQNLYFDATPISWGEDLNGVAAYIESLGFDLIRFREDVATRDIVFSLFTKGTREFRFNVKNEDYFVRFLENGNVCAVPMEDVHKMEEDGELRRW